MDLLTAQRVLWMIGLLVEIILAGAIIERRLAGRYPFFLAFLVAQSIFSVLLLQIDYYSPAYATAFRWYQWAMIVLRLGVAVEVFERITEHFIGIGRFRFYMGAILAIISGSVAWVIFQPLAPRASYPQTLILLLERWQTTVVSVAMILIWWFLTRFLSQRPPMRANVVSHWRLVVVYFLLDAAWSAAAIWDATLKVRMIENVAMLAAEIGCFIAWIMLLRRSGESVAVEPPMAAEELAARRLMRRRILEYVQQAGR